MSQNYGMILTSLGKERLATAQSTNSFLELSHIIIGDRVNAQNEVVTTEPHEDTTTLVNQKASMSIESIKKYESTDEGKTTHGIVCRAGLEGSVGGFTIREIGILDKDSNLIAYGTFPETYKPASAEGVESELVINAIIAIANEKIDVIKLHLDANVLATVPYVDEKVAVLVSKDSELEASINTLRTDMQSEDNTLKAYVDAEDAKIKSQQSSDVSTLNGKIEDVKTAYKAADNAVRSEFASADASLKSYVDAEDTKIKSQQSSDVSTLNGNIEDVKTAYKAADNAVRSEFASADATLKSYVNTKDNEVKNSLEFYVDSQVGKVAKTFSPLASSYLFDGQVSIGEGYEKSFEVITYTGNGNSQEIQTGIASTDFTDINNGSSFYFNQEKNAVTDLAGNVVVSGEVELNVSKLHIKNLSSSTTNNIVLDGIQGISNELYTNLAFKRVSNTNNVTAFTTTGFKLGDGSANTAGEKYVAYQTLYTHIRWGVSNHNRKFIEAYNPYTLESMMLYEGSGNTGHKLQTGLNRKLDLVEIKSLFVDNQWVTQAADMSESQAISLNTNSAMVDTDSYMKRLDNGCVIVPSQTGGSNTNNALVNALGNLYVMYAKAKSAMWSYTTYTGNGLNQYHITTTNGLGVQKRPARVIIKRLDGESDWHVHDNQRGSSKRFWLNKDVGEGNSEVLYKCSFSNIGFVLNGSEDNSSDKSDNLLNAKYIALIEFDTKENSGGSYYDKELCKTKSLAVTKYVGNGSTQEVCTGVNTVNLHYEFGKNYNKGDIVFSKNALRLLQKESVEGNLGDEVIPNGTFDSSINPWQVNAGSISHIEGDLKVTTSSDNYAYAYVNVSLVPGEYYAFCVQAGETNAYAGKSLFRLADINGNPIIDSYEEFDKNATIEGFFKAEKSQTQVQLRISQAKKGIYAKFKSISIKQLSGWKELEENEVVKANTSKVFVKALSDTHSGVFFDSFQGKGFMLKSADTSKSQFFNEGFNGFTDRGFKLNCQNSKMLNAIGKEYIAHQNLYTHLKYGKTGHARFYIEAYNPETLETMIIYEGSGSSGHTIPHSLGVKPEYGEVKNITRDASWVVFEELFQKGSYGHLHTAGQLTGNDANLNVVTSNTLIDLNAANNNSSYLNHSSSLYVVYAKASSKTSKVLTYTGTSLSQFIETKNSEGIAQRPVRVIIKRIDADASWHIFDNKRGSTSVIKFDVEEPQQTSEAYKISFLHNGFMIENALAELNTLNAKYLAIVDFDMYQEKDGSYLKNTSKQHISVENGYLSYSNGIDENGFKLSSEKNFKETNILNVKDGWNYVYKDRGGAYKTTAYEPLFFKNKVSIKSVSELETTAEHITFESETGVVSSSSNTINDGNHFSWHAFDKSTTLRSQWVLSDTNEGWLQYTFKEPKVLRAFRMSTSFAGELMDRFIKDYEIIGVNGSSEEVLHAGSNPAIHTANTFIDMVYVDNTKLFEAIKLKAKTNHGSTTNIAIGDLELYYSSMTNDYFDSQSGYWCDSNHNKLENRVYIAKVYAQGGEIIKIDADWKPPMAAVDILYANEYKGKNVCTAWVAFDGMATPPAILDSFNVQDIIRVSPGVYEVYFKKDFASTNYVPLASASEATNSSSRVASFGICSENKVSVLTHYDNGLSFTLADSKKVVVSIYGGKN